MSEFDEDQSRAEVPQRRLPILHDDLRSDTVDGEGPENENEHTNSAIPYDPSAASAEPNEAVVANAKPVLHMRATVTLIALNVLVFLFTNGISDSARDPELVDAGAMYGPAFVHGEWWRIVTSAFLHANVVHITMNMIALLQVGSLIETMLGARRMLAAYTFSMLTSGLSILIFSFSVPSIGASGAIFGLFGTLVALGVRLGRDGRMLVGQVLPIIGINLVIGFVVPGISSAAHVGGLVGGFVAGFALLAMGRLAAVPVANRRSDAT